LQTNPHPALSWQAWSVSEVTSNTSYAAGRARGAPGAAVATGPQLMLTPKPGTLKDHRGAPFVDVRTAPAPAGHPPGSCGVYALTGTGSLVLMRATGRIPDKAVDLKVGRLTEGPRPLL
jgi:hypothetical protein